MKTINLLIDEKLHNKLKVHCAKKNITRSNLIREFLEKEVNQ